ncbi:hypothetical protein ACJX0J_023889, partial [Zea mays]
MTGVGFGAVRFCLGVDDPHGFEDNILHLCTHYLLVGVAVLLSIFPTFSFDVLFLLHLQ